MTNAVYMLNISPKLGANTLALCTPVSPSAFHNALANYVLVDAY